MAVIRRSSSLKSSDIPAQAAAPSGPHHALVERAQRWLRGTCGCSAILAELKAFTTSGECPDAIGWRSEYSILVECKTSRSDFLADHKKPFRRNPELGVGTYRFFMCPPGVVGPEDLPPGWGLLYAEDQKIRVVAGPVGNAWAHGENKRYIHPRNQESEIAMLVSALRRKG